MYCYNPEHRRRIEYLRYFREDEEDCSVIRLRIFFYFLLRSFLTGEDQEARCLWEPSDYSSPREGTGRRGRVQRGARQWPHSQRYAVTYILLGYGLRLYKCIFSWFYRISINMLNVCHGVNQIWITCLCFWIWRVISMKNIFHRKSHNLNYSISMFSYVVM